LILDFGSLEGIVVPALVSPCTNLGVIEILGLKFANPMQLESEPGLLSHCVKATPVEPQPTALQNDQNNVNAICWLNGPQG